MSTLKSPLTFVPHPFTLDGKHTLVAIQGPLGWSAVDLLGPDGQTVTHEQLFKLADETGTITECAEEALSALLAFARDLDRAAQLAAADEVAEMLRAMDEEGTIDTHGMTQETVDELSAAYENERHAIEAEHLAQEAMRPRRSAVAAHRDSVISRSGGLR